MVLATRVGIAPRIDRCKRRGRLAEAGQLLPRLAVVSVTSAFSSSGHAACHPDVRVRVVRHRGVERQILAENYQRDPLALAVLATGLADLPVAVV